MVIPFWIVLVVSWLSFSLCLLRDAFFQLYSLSIFHQHYTYCNLLFPFWYLSLPYVFLFCFICNSFCWILTSFILIMFPYSSDFVFFFTDILSGILIFNLSQFVSVYSLVFLCGLLWSCVCVCVSVFVVHRCRRDEASTHVMCFFGTRFIPFMKQLDIWSVRRWIKWCRRFSSRSTWCFPTRCGMISSVRLQRWESVWNLHTASLAHGWGFLHVWPWLQIHILCWYLFDVFYSCGQGFTYTN